jgi:hypothetical protein
MEAVIFMFCLTLHNIEEALWLTDWQRKNMPSNKRTMEKEHFFLRYWVLLFLDTQRQGYIYFILK